MRIRLAGLPGGNYRCKRHVIFSAGSGPSTLMFPLNCGFGYLHFNSSRLLLYSGSFSLRCSVALAFSSNRNKFYVEYTFDIMMAASMNLQDR